MATGFFSLWAAVATVLPAGSIQQKPDSAARVALAQAVRAAEDSLTKVRGATAGFRADLAGASPTLVFSRARRLHASCTGADQALLRLDSVLMRSYPAGPPPVLRREARALRGALATCRREYDTEARWAARADSVRAWAPHRLRQLDEALRRYSVASAPYRKTPARR